MKCPKCKGKCYEDSSENIIAISLCKFCCGKRELDWIEYIIGVDRNLERTPYYPLDTKCPRCKTLVEIEEWDDSFKCPNCSLNGYWDEVSDEVNSWGVWHWNNFWEMESK